jgi:hypothetical protein
LEPLGQERWMEEVGLAAAVPTAAAATVRMPEASCHAHTLRGVSRARAERVKRFES